MSDSLQPYGSLPARLLCPWDSPGKNTGVGCHALLLGIFPTQEPASIKIHLLLVESINLNNNNSNQFLSTFYVPITILNTSCASPRILLLQFFEAVTILIYVFVCKECFNNTMQTGCFNKKKSVSQGSGGWDQGVSRAGPLVFISIILISAFIFTWYSPFVFSLFLCPNFPFLIRLLVVLD